MYIIPVKSMSLLDFYLDYPPFVMRLCIEKSIFKIDCLVTTRKTVYLKRRLLQISEQMLCV